MKNSMASRRHKALLPIWLCTGLLLILTVASLFAGKYPLTLSGLLAGNEMQLRVFLMLRVSRTLTGVLGGVTLGIAGFVYQTVMRNPLASPDVIGVSSGASAGAAFGILFLSGATAVTASAFAGALLAMTLSLSLAALDRSARGDGVVLAGIAVHSVAQVALMLLKLTADPERQLASIEYWIMGSLSGVSGHSIGFGMIVSLLCSGAMLLLHRQCVLLSGDGDEARMLGVPVGKMRLALLCVATLGVSAVVSLTGLISFIGLLAPHIARLLSKNNTRTTMLLSGLLGGCLLCGADILARSIAAAELPVSIFTSLLGAPLLILLIVRRRRA